MTGESLDGPWCDGDGFEGRAAVGTSFLLLGREGFVNGEAGFRSRGDPECDRTLAELAIGMEVAPQLTVMVKSWAQDGVDAQSAKVEATLLYDFGDFSLGAGWREEVSGLLEEEGWASPPRAASDGDAYFRVSISR